MGSGFSSFFTAKDAGAPANSTPLTPVGLGDLPENCLAMILAYLDPPEICKLGRVSQAFRRASCADFVWESKLPENYRVLVKKLMLCDRSSEGFAKRDMYERLCCPVRFSSGTKEIWTEKSRGGVCMSVSWRGMKITGIDDRRYWTHISTHESRFHTVAYLQQVWWLEVEGDLEFEFPAGSYNLFFRLKLGRPSKGQNRQCASINQQIHGWNIKPVRFHFSVSNGQHATSECFLNEQGKWLCYQVGNFVIKDSYKPTKIKFSMTQIDCTHQKGGLSLDSVMIFPTKLET